ncbi:hypothetical protein CM240_0278 [Clostridium bornimense]|uniref:GGDEF domain-containing protein n=1 Tax=Clostridium bornimense TaxID=1216932 RepID=W6SCX8_9CLOT|nr:GGDEF domain-containing protein [Clostridium bornimense]CDM67445.1 hypothetical protein CM240_0278 [Clostridium bornimense]
MINGISGIEEIIEGLEVRPRYILNIEKLVFLKNKCKTIVKNINDDKELFKIYYLMGLLERSFVEYEKAIIKFKKALEYAWKIDDKIWCARNFVNIGMIYSKIKDDENSQKYLKLGFDLIKNHDDLDETLIIHIQSILKNKYEKYNKDKLEKELERLFDYISEGNKKEYGYYCIIIGTRYIELLNNYTMGMKCLLKALEIAETYKLIEVKCIVMYNIGVSYYDGMHKYKEAIRYLEPIVYNSQYEFMDINLRCSSAVTLVESYIYTNEFQNVDFCINYIINNKAKLSKFVKDSIEAMILYLKASIGFARGDNFNEALKYAMRAQESYNINVDTFAFSHFDFNLIMLIGKIYFALQDYEKSIETYKEAICIGQRWGHSYEMKAYEALADSYEKIEDYNNALKYYKKYDKLFEEYAEMENMELVHKEFEKVAMDERIKELSEINEIIERELYVDSLTSLFNRKYLNNVIKDNGEVRRISVMMLDIDYFKLYNDNYGHIMGDEVLEKVAKTIKSCCNEESDKAIRYGGEEFLILSYTENVNYIEGLRDKIKESLYSVNIEHKYSKVSDRVTISIGISNGVTNNKNDYLRLIEEADKDLYNEKRHRSFKDGI